MKVAARLVALFLLLAPATASAECAWVLWFTSGRTSTNSSPSEAFKTKDDCEEGMRQSQKMIDRFKREHPQDVAYFTCLPDAVDPRGPKGK